MPSVRGNPLHLHDTHIDDTEWNTLQSYAQLVRELKYTEPRPKVHYSMWRILAQKLKGEPLLPRLQRLEVSAAPPDPSAGLLVISPSIQSLRVYAARYGEYAVNSDGTTLLNALFVALCSGGTEVPPILAGATPTVTRHLQSMGRLAHLQAIDVFEYGAVMHYSTMQALSTLENLRSLGVWVNFQDADSLMPSQEGFEALESFTVRGELDHVYQAIQMAGSPRLRKLGIAPTMKADVGEFRTFLAGVQRAIPSELSTLQLYPGFTATSAPLSLSSILEPLCTLRHLRELSCQFYTYPKDPSAEDIAAIATAWPDLRSLCIVYYEEKPYAREPIPFSALIDLAERCPSLQSIALTNIDIRLQSPPSSVPRLEQSCVGYLQLDNVIGALDADLLALALVVERLFPNLRMPRYIRYDVTSLPLWERVLHIVAGIQAARRMSH
ncbi:hypothetical protein L226DRAFT_573411 [Lentinus tigrinus ALCF2SS1-7]|nr:hypothetical protein L226DRAFT_573411 [Lentinus tigrinus ALCF2SS1-7]